MDNKAPAHPLLSVSIDLDSIACYWRIHGMRGELPAAARHSVLRRCLPRFGQLFAEEGIRATFFVVGSDLQDDPEGCGILADLVRAGHELANHTYSHPYDLIRKDPTAVAAEIGRAHDAISACAGRPPVGFRAPGYSINGAVLDELCTRAYTYDSSAFPSAPYYLAKATIIGGMRLVGRRSGSILDTPRVLAAPRTPYRPAAGAPYTRGDLPLLELPITVTPRLRLPVIGTSLVAAPEPLRRRLVASALGTGFFNLELHGIDLADAVSDAIPRELIAKEPALKLSLERKLNALTATLREAKAAGALALPLAEVVERF